MDGVGSLTILEGPTSMHYLICVGYTLVDSGMIFLLRGSTCNAIFLISYFLTYLYLSAMLYSFLFHFLKKIFSNWQRCVPSCNVIHIQSVSHA